MQSSPDCSCSFSRNGRRTARVTPFGGSLPLFTSAGPLRTSGIGSRMPSWEGPSPVRQPDRGADVGLLADHRDKPVVLSGLSFDPPRLPGTRLRHQGNAAGGRGGLNGINHVLITLSDSPRRSSKPITLLSTMCWWMGQCIRIRWLWHPQRILRTFTSRRHQSSKLTPRRICTFGIDYGWPIRTS